MRLITPILVLTIAVACLVAANSPRYTVRRATISSRRFRRRDCAQAGESSSISNLDIKDSKQSISDESAGASDASGSSSSLNINMEVFMQSSDEPTDSSGTDSKPTDSAGANSEDKISADASSSESSPMQSDDSQSKLQSDSSSSSSNDTGSASAVDNNASQLGKQENLPIDPNSIISNDGPDAPQGGTVVDKKDPSQADPKDSGVTFNGSVIQYNVKNDACLSKSTDNDLVAALNAQQYEELVDKNNNPIRCYECVLIHGDKGDVEVTIVDECPGCEKDMLNLSPAAFALATSKTDMVAVTWEFVVCSAESFSKMRPDKNGSGSQSSKSV